MRFAHFAAGTSLLALSACADLGFTDLPMATLPESLSGPVQLTELDADPGASAEAPEESFQMASTTPRAPQPLMTGKPMIDTVSPKSPGSSSAATKVEAAPKDTSAASSTSEAASAGSATMAKEAEADTQVAMATPDPKPEPAPAAKPDATVGQCFANITIPAQTRETTEQVLVSEATTKTETIPATYKTVTEEVLVSEATTRTEVVPATYKTETRMVPVAAAATEGADTEFEEVTEEVLVKPEETREVTVEAVYENVTERVKVKDAYTEWRPGGKVYAIGAEALGGTVLANRVTSSGVMTLVEIPAEFENVTKRVLVTPATTKSEVVPAEYETVTRRVPVAGSEAAGEPEMREVQVRVVDQPATVRTVPVAAEYKTMTRRVVDTPAMVRTVPVPAVYRDEVKSEIITPARTERVEVICEASAVPDFIKSLQRALRARGLYDGEIDGKSGPATRAAIKEYQSGASEILTIESARSLGLAV